MELQQLLQNLQDTAIEKTKHFDTHNDTPVFALTEEDYHVSVSKSSNDAVTTSLHSHNNTNYGFTLTQGKDGGKLSGSLYINGKAYSYNSKEQ